VHGPKGLVRIGDGLSPKWNNEAIIRGNENICRVPDLEGGSRWRLTPEAREDLFRPKPKEDAPKDDHRASTVASPSVPPATALAAPPKVEDAAHADAAEVREKHADRLVRRTTEKDLLAAKTPDPPNGDFVAVEFLPGHHGEHKPKAFDWIRFNNQEHARKLRREISEQTRQAALAGGYRKDGRLVKLQRVQEMLDGTKRIAPSLGTYEAPKSTGVYASTKVRGMNKLTLAAGIELRDEYGERAVGAVSAASSYHCGGGFETGGRHALEEAICIQTTAFLSLAKMEHEVLHAIQSSHGRFGDYLAYIPADGVILSPLVEIFRDGSDAGYPFLKGPLQLAALISLGMYNKNERMSDCPVDAPSSSAEYKMGVKQKFRSMFGAAVKAHCVALVVPDVGCGVYQNDAKEVGACLGEVLREEFWGHFREVVLVGKKEFQDSVIRTCESVGKRLDEELEASTRSSRRSPPPPAERVSERSSRRSPSPPPERVSERRSERIDPSPLFSTLISPEVILGGAGVGLLAPSAPSPPAPPQPARLIEASPPPSSAPPQVVKAGATVMIKDIPGLHGQEGTVVQWLPNVCRWEVRVPTKGMLKLKGENMVPVHVGSVPSRPPIPPPSPAVTPSLDDRRVSGTPSPRDEAITMCKFGCGRPAKEGFLPSGKAFDTCCRTCARRKGDGSHDSECAFGEVVLHENHGGGGRRHSGGRRDPSSDAGRSDNGRSFSPPPSQSVSPRPSTIDRPICKFGCGRRAAPGTTRSGKPLDTCCKKCAMSKGRDGHGPECQG